MVSRGFALKSTRPPRHPKILDENTLGLDSNDTIKKDTIGSDNIVLKGYALKSTRAPRNPQRLNESCMGHFDDGGRDLLGGNFWESQNSEKRGKALWKLVQCAKRSRSPQRILQTFLEKAAMKQNLNTRENPTREESDCQISKYCPSAVELETVDMDEKASLGKEETKSQLMVTSTCIPAQFTKEQGIENIDLDNDVETGLGGEITSNYPNPINKLIELVSLPLSEQTFTEELIIEKDLGIQDNENPKVVEGSKNKQEGKYTEEKKNEKEKCQNSKFRQNTVKAKRSNVSAQVKKSKSENTFSEISENREPLGARTTHICAVCKASFSKVGNLNVHVLIHSDEKPYKCSHCDRGFSHQSTLKSHVLIHSGQKPQSCSRCDYTCRQVGTLNSHIKKKHAK